MTLLLTAGREPEILTPVPPLDSAIQMLEAALSSSAPRRQLVQGALGQLYVVRHRRDRAKYLETHPDDATCPGTVGGPVACRCAAVRESHSKSGGFLRREFKGRKVSQSGQPETRRALSSVQVEQGRLVGTLPTAN